MDWKPEENNSQTNNRQESQSAIQIKCNNQEMRRNRIIDTLNSQISKYTDVRKIISRITRNNSILIIKSDTDANTEFLLKFIEDIDLLKDKIEIILKSNDLRKIIITGIPTTTHTKNLLEQIQKQQNPNIPTTIHKNYKLKETWSTT